MNTSLIPKLNWCQYVLRGLVESVMKWQKNPNGFFCGPLTFLLLCYVDRVQYKLPIHLKRMFPVIHCWDDSTIDNRLIVEEREEGFGHGRAMPHIEIPQGHRELEETASKGR